VNKPERGPSAVREFGIRNLQLESELLRLEEEGIPLGHRATLEHSKGLVEFDLFESEVVRDAEFMSEFYKVYFCLENSIRRFISDRMSEIHGDDWWSEKVPDPIQRDVKNRQEDEKTGTATIRSTDPLDYTFLGELAAIMTSNWVDFSDTLRSPQSVNRALTGFNKIRNVIAHSCLLQEDELLRLKLAVRDWFRIQSS